MRPLASHTYCGVASKVLLHSDITVRTGKMEGIADIILGVIILCLSVFRVLPISTQSLHTNFETVCPHERLVRLLQIIVLLV